MSKGSGGTRNSRSSVSQTTSKATSRLNSAEKKAISAYTAQASAFNGGKYDVLIRAGLATNKSDVDMMKEDFYRGIEKLPDYRSKEPLYRGVDVDTNTIKSYKKGDVLTFRGYQSTTDEEETASLYTRGDKTSVVFEIRGHSGGKNITKYSRNDQSMKEVVFKPNQKFEVVGIIETTNGVGMSYTKVVVKQKK